MGNEPALGSHFSHGTSSEPISANSINVGVPIPHSSSFPGPSNVKQTRLPCAPKNISFLAIMRHKEDEIEPLFDRCMLATGVRSARHAMPCHRPPE